MYVKVKNGQPANFPYSLGQLKKDNPRTSFPETFSEQALAGSDIYPVTPTSAPECDSKTHRHIAGVENKGGVWVQTWQIQPLPEQRAAENIRAERNRRLADCDWTQLEDTPLDADGKLAWSLYRETLRMVPQQAGFPWKVEWPPAPGTN